MKRCTVCRKFVSDTHIEEYPDHSLVEVARKSGKHAPTPKSKMSYGRLKNEARKEVSREIKKGIETEVMVPPKEPKEPKPVKPSKVFSVRETREGKKLYIDTDVLAEKVSKFFRFK